MLKQPRFKPHLRVDVVPGEGAFVLSGAKQTLLKGRLFELVVPHVGGGRSPGDVADQLEGQVSPAEVFYVLAHLEKKGYLCEEDSDLDPAAAALWSALQLDPAEASRRLAGAAVSVRGFGMDAGPFADLLRAAGVRVEEQGGGAVGLAVVLADGYLRDELREVNEAALRDGSPWLLARPMGRQIWVGPLFRPGETGCWECLAHRLRANAPVHSYLDSRQGRPAPAVGETAATPATLQAAFGLAAHAVAAWAARGGLPELEGTLRSFDLATWQAQAHPLTRLPYCPACGSGARPRGDGPRPVVLGRGEKAYTKDGGHRVVPPEVTLERYNRHVSPITGAVTMLERVGPAGDGAVHVYLAGHNLARRHHSLDHLRGDLRNMSSGKGASDAQAKASGLCEGLERYSGVFRGDEPRRTARLADLGGAGVHPHDCLLFSERQYRGRDEWNRRESRFNFVPVPFDPEAEVEWTPVWSLTRGEPRYLPTAFCYFDYPRTGEPFCVACSNGNAAGNTPEEAILQGFFEVVERDAVALWWYNRVNRPAVDLDAFDDGYLGRLRAFLRTKGRELWALDLTSDLGIPVFAALSRVPGAEEERVMLGFGAHLDARVALLRAVTEMNQMLAGLLHGADDPNGPLPDHLTDEETVRWLRTATLTNQPYLLPDASPARTPADFPRSWSDDVTEDVRACQARVEALGLEMLVLDQTRPEIGLPVAKVIVPGLRHFWARFAPGRLYDVPVTLGWLARPTPEEELNPTPMFL